MHPPPESQTGTTVPCKSAACDLDCSSSIVASRSCMDRFPKDESIGTIITSCPCSWMWAILKRGILAISFYFFPHRALAALAAIWDRLRGDSAAALASPPFRPPRRPSATAWGFLAGSIGFAWGCAGSNLTAWPVDSSMIWYASWFGSRGRCFVDRSGISQCRHSGTTTCKHS
jgi:hypothetical protein